MSDRWPELRISCPRDQGFIVWESGEPIASLTSRAELAEWIERALGAIPGEAEREQRDLAAMQEALGNVTSFPNVASPRTDPTPTGIWRRRR